MAVRLLYSPTRLFPARRWRTFSLSPARHSPATEAPLLHSPARHSPAMAVRLLYSPTRLFPTLFPVQREANGSPHPGDMMVAASTGSGAASSLSPSQHQACVVPDTYAKGQFPPHLLPSPILYPSDLVGSGCLQGSEWPEFSTVNNGCKWP
uniref:Uncharacterized protein n=1 Tax=Oryza barthii TaxID=65489 RepID=A0A0D3HM65_9ORYZ